MCELRLLTKEEYLDIKSRIGRYLENELTDYAKLFTCSYIDLKKGSGIYGLQPYYLEEERERSISDFWIVSEDKGLIVSVTNNVRENQDETYNWHGIKAVIDFKEIEEDSKFVSKQHLHDIYHYGDYPQRRVSDEEAEILDRLLKLKFISLTGETYTYNKNYYIEDSNPEFENFLEYEADDKRYVHLYTESEGKIKSVWYEVEPIEWIVDRETKLAFPRKVLMSGIPFKDKSGNNILKDYVENEFSYQTQKEEPYKQLKLNM